MQMPVKKIKIYNNMSTFWRNNNNREKSIQMYQKCKTYYIYFRVTPLFINDNKYTHGK